VVVSGSELFPWRRRERPDFWSERINELQSLGDGVIRQVFEKPSNLFVHDRAGRVGTNSKREIARGLIVRGLPDEIPVDFRAGPRLPRVEGKVVSGSSQEPFGKSAMPRL
jgi:hypothetical protein